MQTIFSPSMRSKLFAGFGLILILLAVVVLTAYRGISEVQEAQKRLLEGAIADKSDLREVRTNQIAIRADVASLFLSGDRSKQEELHAEIKARYGRNGELMRGVIERNKHNPVRLAKTKEFDAQRQAYRDVRESQVIPLIYAGKSEEAKQIFFVDQAKRNEQLQQLADELVDDAEQMEAIAIAQSEQATRQFVRTFIVASAIAALLSVVIAAWIFFSLRRVTREIGEGVNVLASSASEITASTTQVASGSAETASAVSETTATVEEVKQTAQVSTQKARYVSDTALKVVQISQDGKKAIDDSVAAMGRIQEQMESVADSIVRLSEQGQAIGEIIATVNGLAEQSNLLAVNAGIEAAKAGEQGRGFAVVAQEVKSLAEQSKQATAQVRTILGDIQKATSSAVMATEQGSKAVDAGVRLSEQLGESIRILAEAIEESAQAATQIAASAQQQMVGMDQVVLAMQNINQASVQNVASTRQAETAAQGLHGLGVSLKQLVEQYRM